MYLSSSSMKRKLVLQHEEHVKSGVTETQVLVLSSNIRGVHGTTKRKSQEDPQQTKLTSHHDVIARALILICDIIQDKFLIVFSFNLASLESIIVIITFTALSAIRHSHTPTFHQALAIHATILCNIFKIFMTSSVECTSRKIL